MTVHVVNVKPSLVQNYDFTITQKERPDFSRSENEVLIMAIRERTI